MKTFTTKPNSFKELRNRLLLNYFAMAVLLVAFMCITNNSGDSNKASDQEMWFVLIPIMGGAFCIGIFMGIRKQRQIFESYSLSVTDNSIIREQKSTPTITMPFEDITRIVKSDNGAFSILGKGKLDAIIIPAQITDVDQLESMLNGIKPIDYKKSNPWLALMSIPVIVITLGLLAVLYVAKNKWLVGFSGFTLCAAMLIGFVVIQRSKNVDYKTKQLSFITFIPLLSFGAITVMKLLA